MDTLCSVGRLDLTHRCRSTEHANLLSVPIPHYYSHSKEPYSKMHPICPAVSTFILAEFNYTFPFFSILARSHSSKTLNPLLYFLITVLECHQSAPMFTSHHAQCVCARGVVMTAAAVGADIRGINHRLVHLLVRLQTNNV